VAFDVLRIDGKNMMDASFEERRAALVRLPLRPPTAVVAETFADGAALFDAVCKLGLEGVVAKRLSSRYRANQRGWIKTRIRTTGVATPSERRCSARGSVVSELTSSARRAERQQVAPAIGVVAPALGDGCELVNLPLGLRAPDRHLVHGENLARGRQGRPSAPNEGEQDIDRTGESDGCSP